MKPWYHSRILAGATTPRILLMILLACSSGIFAAEVCLPARQLSASWNEPYHILAGMSCLRTADYGINPEHPPLAKLVAALPLLSMRLQLPRLGFDVSKQTANTMGRALVYNNDADSILFRGRLAVAVFGFLLMALIFEAGFRMFGVGTSIIAILLALFEPNLLAHSVLVTTDIGLSCLFFGSVYAFWRVAERPSILRMIGCGVVTGLALAVKYSAILLIPTLMALASVEIASRFKSARAGGGVSVLRILLREKGIWLARLMIIGGFAVLVLWGFYSFRYRARPGGIPLRPSLTEYTHVLNGRIWPKSIAAAEQLKALPESYLYGLSDMLLRSGRSQPTFLLGRLYPHGLWYYFPSAFIIKSTLGSLALLLLGLACCKYWSGEFHRKAAYLLIPSLIFMGASVTSGFNIGIRHVLPIYPFLILAAAAGGWELTRRHPAWAAVVAALLAFHMVSSLRSIPNYLAYSNELFGGPDRTYRVLTDSNVDWGQGLIATRDYLHARNITDCQFAYFGIADPAYYHIPCKMLPDPFLPWWGKPAEVPPESLHGVVLISATEIAGPFWGPDELNPYGQFMQMRPVANIGGSILVFEGDFDLRLASAQARLNRAWELYRAGRQEEAIQEILKSAELAPTHPGPPFLVGFILARAKRTAAARLQFQEALNLAEKYHREYQWFWIYQVHAELARLP